MTFNQVAKQSSKRGWPLNIENILQTSKPMQLWFVFGKINIISFFVLGNDTLSSKKPECAWTCLWFSWYKVWLRTQKLRYMWMVCLPSPLCWREGWDKGTRCPLFSLSLTSQRLMRLLEDMRQRGELIGLRITQDESFLYQLFVDDTALFVQNS